MHDRHTDPVNVFVEGVEARLLSLDSNAAMGPDGRYSHFGKNCGKNLKKCAKQLALHLSIISEQYLGERYVPKAWKRSW